MSNIFEGAKFGDKLVTRDGRKATFVRKLPKDTLLYECIIENGALWTYNPDGSLHRDFASTIKSCPEQNRDIVSRYQKPIDEEKLEKLAEKYVIDWYKTNNIPMEQFEIDKKISKEDFKAGYRKAKEK